MLKRMHITIRGAVQGVGFRPFIYRLAADTGVAGWVVNASQGVLIDAEGDDASVERFLLRIGREKPQRAFIQSLEYSFLDPVGYSSFEIRESDGRGDRSVLVMADIATCPECLADIMTPGNRRYGYPFTNCTNCGPRFTIIESLPYDRPGTSMKQFVMCGDCQREYEDPSNRRFHAQPNACPVCGPHIELWNGDGFPIARRDEAFDAAAAMLAAGKILAVKGIGGFHLMADARNESSVALLRSRKHREEKPFALMAPHLDWIRSICEVDPLEERILCSPESPIVLLRKRQWPLSQAHALAAGIAPRNPMLGFMLPSTPLHHLLLHALGFPLVATSGNLTDEPICTDEQEALARLHGIADAFLVHNRPIVRHVDDSIVRVLMGRELVLRRARGYAPLPVPTAQSLPDAIAVGAHLKNSVAFTRGSNIFGSQHIGDLETEQATHAFTKAIDDFRSLYQLKPGTVVADMHPDYISTVHAKAMDLPVVQVQHHHAHVAACMAENELHEPVLGVAWDGTGWGPDGTIWGGEFLLVNKNGYRRAASFRTFMLPGGEAAVREPRRTAMGMLYEVLGDQTLTLDTLPPLLTFDLRERKLLHHMLARGINSPRTSSVGRLFDGIASILDLRQRMAYEGQAAMELEFASGQDTHPAPYEIPLRGPTDRGSSQRHAVIDWAPMLLQILDDVKHHLPIPAIASRFHHTLAEAVVTVAEAVGEQKIVLSGGCFQNALLTTLTVTRLREAGFLVYWHQRIPPNDGGIAAGQLYAAVACRGNTK